MDEHCNLKMCLHFIYYGAQAYWISYEIGMYFILNNFRPTWNYLKKLSFVHSLGKSIV